ncbi:MAG: sigma-70 family RNA polymerase sigma factor [Planctomycetales bacterium]
MTRELTPSDHADDPGSTSLGLLEQVQARQVEGWDRLTQLYGPLVYRWARECGLQGGDAADVAQDVFRAIVMSVGDFQKTREGDSFRGWLWTITRNKIRDFFRRRKSEPQALGGSDAKHQLGQLADLPPEESRSTQDGLLSPALEAVRSEFEERTWRAFWRTAVDQDRPVDVAEDLKMSLHAVYKAKSRVLRRLREELSFLIDENEFF